MSSVVVWLRDGRSLLGWVLLLGVLLLVTPVPVWADAPIGGGPDMLPIGSVGTAPTDATDASAAEAAQWQQVQPLPPLGSPAFPSHGRLSQNGGDGSAIAWLDRNLNPGNWVLDAGMGIFAGVIKTIAGLLQRAVLVLLGHDPPSISAVGRTPMEGAWSVIPPGCVDRVTNFVFCVPASLTYDHPGVQTVWHIVHGIAVSLVTLLFVVRIGRLLGEGPRGLATEGKRLTLTFLLATAFIQSTYPICRLVITFVNSISTLLLAQASATLPATDVGDLNMGSNLMVVVIWALLLLLTLKSFGRLVQIIVLLAVAPLAGALLMDPSTSPRFRAWFDKLLTLLLSQVNLAIIFIVLAAILQPYQHDHAGDTFVSFLLAILMLGMALNGQSVIGIAGTALGGGNGVLTFLRYQVAGTALRGMTGGRAGDRLATRAVAAVAQHGVVAGAGALVPHGDPTRSVAATRPSPGPVALRRIAVGNAPTGVAVPAHVFPARDIDGSGGRSSLATRRAAAIARGTLMRQRAAVMRAAGDDGAATVLERKAQLHTQFGRGEDITRPARSAEDRATRRMAYRQALVEVDGLHALEREQVAAQFARDAARAPVLQRALAHASATGGETAALHAEHTALVERQAAQRARIETLTPRTAGHPAVVTRQAAAALANERLPQPLRAHAFALRYALTTPSPLVRRLTTAPTQEAQDELARARALGARTPDAEAR